MALASARFAVVALVLSIAGCLAAHWFSSQAVYFLLPPFALTALALTALLLQKQETEKGWGLAICHMALLVMIFLTGLGWLTSLKGWVEVASGAWFEGQLMGEERAWLHGGDLAKVRFRNLGFEVAHGPELRRRQTRNRVEWRNAQDEVGTMEIGDGQALVLANYRFSTSSNKGYAPTFVWYPKAGGEAVRGVVNLPSFPLFSGQSNRWVLPGTDRSMLTLLQFDQPFPPYDRPWIFPGSPSHHLRLTSHGESWEMRPGDRKTLAEGVLVYEKLGSWMGYRVFYDWTMPWLLAASLVATLGLVSHVSGRFAAQPWHSRWGDEGG